jgi:methyl-accepting chemotaxis protein
MKNGLNTYINSKNIFVKSGSNSKYGAVRTDAKLIEKPINSLYVPEIGVGILHIIAFHTEFIRSKMHYDKLVKAISNVKSNINNSKINVSFKTFLNEKIDLYVKTIEDVNKLFVKNVELTKVMRDVVHAVEENISKIYNAASEKAVRNRDSLITFSTTMISLSSIVAVIALVLSVLLILAILGYILSNLLSIVTFAKKLENKEFDVSYNVDTKDEFGDISTALNSATKSLKDSTE